MAREYVRDAGTALSNDRSEFITTMDECHLGSALALPVVLAVLAVPLRIVFLYVATAEEYLAAILRLHRRLARETLGS
jgi:ABC-type sulfate transport system permease subunit